MPLRRWLMNAMSFHCRGLARDAARERARLQQPAAGDAVPIGSIAAAEADAAEAFDRAWALAIVNQAYAQVQADLATHGRAIEDEVMRMHVIDGMPYEAVASALGIPRGDCFNAARHDLNLNGAVDGADIGILLAFWGAVSPAFPRADINGDGTVNGADLGLLLANWGPCPQ